jgi:hypothetical protein
MTYKSTVLMYIIPKRISHYFCGHHFKIVSSIFLEGRGFMGIGRWKTLRPIGNHAGLHEVISLESLLSK